MNVRRFACCFRVAWQAGPGLAGPRVTEPKAQIVNRRLRAVVPATLAVALLALSACGSDQPDPAATATPTSTAAAETPGATPAATPEATPEPAVTPSNNLDGIVVEGPANEAPKFTVPAPWGVDETRNKVILPGDGAVVAENGTVEVHYIGMNGRTGQVFDESWTSQPIAFPLDQVVPGFKKGLEGQRVGSRVLIAMPGVDGYDSMGGNPQAGIEVGDTLVFVVDILSTPLAAAEGDPVQPAEGLPTVVFDGPKPKVTIPAGQPAPNQLVVQPLINGRGKPVQPTDVITAVYQATTWNDGKVVEDTYGGKPEQGPLNTLIPAWQEALKDKPVGSRVLIIAPPDKAYPQDPGARKPHPAMGQTVVYVVDILYTTAGQ